MHACEKMSHLELAIKFKSDNETKVIFPNRLGFSTFKLFFVYLRIIFIKCSSFLPVFLIESNKYYSLPIFFLGWEVGRMRGVESSYLCVSGHL